MVACASAMTKKPIWILAHRCNSTLSLQAACASGANGVEIDVMSSGDRFVVHHPDRLRRLFCNGTVETLAGLPTLEQHLESLLLLAGSFSLIYIDYKGPDMSPETCNRLVQPIRAILAEYPMGALISIADFEDRGFFSRFPPETLILPQIDQGAAPDQVHTFFDEAGLSRASYADGASCSWWAKRRLNRNFERAETLRREHGLFRRLAAWTIDDPDNSLRLLGLGVDVLVTNNSEGLVQTFCSPKAAYKYRLGSADDFRR